MPIVALTGSADVLGGLPTEPTVRVRVVRSTAAENDDGTWSVTAYAAEDQIPGLQALGCDVRVIVTQGDLQDRWVSLAIADDEPDA
jgi:hypothetical protein